VKCPRGAIEKRKRERGAEPISPPARLSSLQQFCAGSTLLHRTLPLDPDCLDAPADPQHALAAISERSKKLAEKYECGVDAIHTAIRRAGVEFRGRRIFSDEEDMQICKEYESGVFLPALSAKWQASPHTIGNSIRRAGGRIQTAKEAAQASLPARVLKLRRFTDQ